MRLTSADKKVLFFQYLSVIVSFLLLNTYIPGSDPFSKLFLIFAFLIILVYIFGYRFGTHTLFSPLWYLLPLLAAWYWFYNFGQKGVTLKTLIATILVAVWSIGMTINWLRNWQGLYKPDFRHEQLARQTGKWYVLLSFLLIYLTSMIMIFLLVSPLYYAFMFADSWHWLNWLGIGLGLLGIIIEIIADNQLYRFVIKQHNPIAVMRFGLWRHIAHPNYLGDLLFWLGLALTAYHPLADYWIFSGIIIYALFVRLISIPVMRTHLLSNKPGYDIYIKSTWPLFPKFFGKKRS